jgi:hypothetical protein
MSPKKNVADFIAPDAHTRKVQGILHCEVCRSESFSPLLSIRSEEYTKLLEEESNSWFESDMMNSYCTLMQHDVHCTRTWFYPIDGCEKKHSVKRARIKYHSATDPCKTSGQYHIMYETSHYAALEIDQSSKVVRIYDGFLDGYSTPKRMEAWES